MPDIWHYLAERLRPIPNPTVLELGAHTGTDTARVYGEFCQKPCRYIAVEPISSNFERLKKRMGDAPGFEAVRAAIWHTDGHEEIWVSEGPGYDGSSSLREPTGHLVAFPNCVFRRRVRIPTVTLNTLCRERGIEMVDFIWCDIQGCEGDMIAGGREALQRTRYLMMEWQGDSELYRGQKLLKDLLIALPDSFQIVDMVGWDILLRNTELP